MVEGRCGTVWVANLLSTPWELVWMMLVTTAASCLSVSRSVHTTRGRHHLRVERDKLCLTAAAANDAEPSNLPATRLALARSCTTVRAKTSRSPQAHVQHPPHFLYSASADTPVVREPAAPPAVRCSLHPLAPPQRQRQRPPPRPDPWPHARCSTSPSRPGPMRGMLTPRPAGYRHLLRLACTL